MARQGVHRCERTAHFGVGQQWKVQWDGWVRTSQQGTLYAMPSCLDFILDYREPLKDFKLRNLINSMLWNDGSRDNMENDYKERKTRGS